MNCVTITVTDFWATECSPPKKGIQAKLVCGDQEKNVSILAPSPLDISCFYELIGDMSEKMRRDGV